jgi:hypothetical protein
MLPPDRYPRVIESAVPLATCEDPEIHYRFRIELFIAGVESIASRLSGADASSV